MPDTDNFPIPDELTPDTICFQIELPNTPQWKAVFMGLLAQPTYWFNWQRDEAHSGKIVSDYWTKLFDQIDWSGMSCCPQPTNSRFTADGVYQTSFDNGATWQDDPDRDPRYTSPSPPPIPGTDGDDKRCQAANNVVQQLKDAQAGYSGSMTGVTTVLALAALLAGLAVLVFLTAGLGTFLIGAFFELASFLLGTTSSAYDALFTSDVWSYCLCKFYCAAASDGTFTQENFSDISADFDTHFTDGVALTLVSTLIAWQLPGLNNAAKVPSTAGLDCSGCDCVVHTCNIDNWSVAFGTEISRTATTISVLSALAGDGLQHIQLVSSDNLGGCQLGNVTWSHWGSTCSWPVGTTFPTSGAVCGGSFDPTCCVAIDIANPIGNTPTGETVSFDFCP